MPAQIVRGSPVTIRTVAIIGLGLLGGSIGLAVKSFAPDIATKGYDRDPAVRSAAGTRQLVSKV